MRRALLITSFWASLWSGVLAQDKLEPQPTQPGKASPEQGQVASVLKATFGEYHLAPIIIPEGERIGDIIDINTGALIAGADDCFPGLKPRKAESQLPKTTFTSGRELAAGLGVSQVAEVNGQSSGGQAFELDFENVRVERVSQLQLRRSLKKNTPECDTVRPFFDTAYSPPEKKTTQHAKQSVVATIGKTTLVDKPPPLLVGMLFYARRVIHVTMTNKLEGAARVSFIEQMMKDLGLSSGFTASFNSGDQSKNVVDIIGTKEVPVAFAPAFIINKITRTASGETKYEIAFLDQDRVENKIRVVRNLNSDYEKKLAAIVGKEHEHKFIFTLERLYGFGHSVAYAGKTDVLKDLMGLRQGDVY